MSGSPSEPARTWPSSRPGSFSSGAIRATLDLALAEKDAETQLRIGTDLTVMGRLGEFGQASIKRKADQLIQDFAECLARQVTMR
jgi:carbon monoxide dehydrogenase subunit G